MHAQAVVPRPMHCPWIKTCSNTYTQMYVHAYITFLVVVQLTVFSLVFLTKHLYSIVFPPPRPLCLALLFGLFSVCMSRSPPCGHTTCPSHISFFLFSCRSFLILFFVIAPLLLSVAPSWYNLTPHCLSVFQSTYIYLAVCRPVFLPVCRPTCTMLSTWLSVYVLLSVRLSYIPCCLFASLSVCPSVCLPLPVCWSVYLSVSLQNAFLHA